MGGGFSPGSIFVTGFHCIMLVLETKAGNYSCSPSSVHIKFLVNMDYGQASVDL